MEFERFSLIPYKIEKGEYKVNAEVVDLVRQEVDAYAHRYGRTPAFLLLGYGTYFSLCIAWTEQVHRYSNFPSNYVEKLNSFDSIRILIDSAYEFRVSCIGLQSPFEEAVNAYFESRKIKD